jgi:hypothetical protein
MWAIRGPLSRRQYWLFAALGLLVPLGLWWGVSSGSAVDKVFLPGPVDVFNRLVTWYTEDELISDMGISIYRVTVGFLFSAAIALPLALMIGTFRPVQAVLEPLTDFIRYMPAVAFIPLVMLWVGIEESSKISIIFIGTFFQMVLMMAEDVRRVPLAQIEAAQTMGAQKGETDQSGDLPGRQAGAARHLARHHGLGLDLSGGGRTGRRQLRPRLFDPEGAAFPADRQDLRRHHPHRADRPGHGSAVPPRAPQGFPLAVSQIMTMPKISIQHVGKVFGEGSHRVEALRTSASTSPTTSSSPSSAPPAAASRRCCASSAGSSTTPPATCWSTTAHQGARRRPRHGVPALQPLPLAHGDGEHQVQPPPQARPRNLREADVEAASGRADALLALMGLPAAATPGPTSSPAACSSASPSPAR